MAGFLSKRSDGGAVEAWEVAVGYGDDRVRAIVCEKPSSIDS